MSIPKYLVIRTRGNLYSFLIQYLAREEKVKEARKRFDGILRQLIRKFKERQVRTR